jgi:periplasmic protein TonB
MYLSSFSSSLRRVPTRLLLVVGLHLIVLWGLLNGLQIHSSQGGQPPDMDITMIDRPAPPVEKFAPRAPPELVIHFTPPVIKDLNLPPPEDQVIADVQREPTTLPSVPIPDSIPQVEPVVTGAAVDPHHPLTQPPYPSSSIRANEEGTLNLSVLVGTDGKVREAKVAQSSGSERLDQAAVNEAKLHWRLRAATRNGVPFEQWLTLRVVFKLEDR